MLAPYIKQIDIQSLKGKFIASYPSISDNRFFKTIIYITEHNDKGAEGVVINKTSAYTFINLINSINNLKVDKKDLPENIKNTRILRGGPVNSDKIFILHSSDYKNSYTTSVDDKISYSKNIEIIEDIIKLQGPKQLSVLIGNCTWTALQLEAEIKNDTWLVYEGNYNDFIFSKDIDKLWQSVYESLGITNTNSSYFTSGEKTLQ